MRNLFRSLVALIALFFLRAADAQTLTLSLAAPNQTGTPGGSAVVFGGTLTNAGSVPIVLDGSAYNFSPSAPGFDASDDPGFLTFLVSGGELAPGAAYDGALFQIVLQDSVTLGAVVDGTATFTGSYLDDFGGSFSTFAASDFRVTAVGSTSVPEPGSVALLIGMTLTGAGFLVRRRNRRE